MVITPLGCCADTGKSYALKEVSLKSMNRLERQEAIDEVRMPTILDSVGCGAGSSFSYCIEGAKPHPGAHIICFSITIQMRVERKEQGRLHVL
jgi:hypothetical protein